MNEPGNTEEIKRLADKARVWEAKERALFNEWWAGGKILQPSDRTGRGYDRDQELAFRAWYARSLKTREENDLQVKGGL